MNKWIHVTFSAKIGAMETIGETDMMTDKPIDCPGARDEMRDVILKSKTKDGQGFPEGTNIVIMGWQRYEE